MKPKLPFKLRPNKSRPPHSRFIYFTLFLLVIAGCTNKKQNVRSEGQNTNSHKNTNQSLPAIPVVDVTKNYPERIIELYDIADVEFIPLETKKGFLFHGQVAGSGNNMLIAYNFEGGDIFIISEDGKFIKKINNSGKGPKEYSHISHLAFDELNSEIYVHDMFIRKTLVYDLDGNFKRSFKNALGRTYTDLCYFNNELIVNNDIERDSCSAFFAISKLDGNITKEISFLYKDKITPRIVVETSPTYSYSTSFYYPRSILTGDGIILNDLSSDTLFKYSTEGKLIPLVKRTPPVHSMEPVTVLVASLETSQYLFLDAMEKNSGKLTMIIQI